MAILGIGGVFIKCADDDALRAWYQRVLGFELEPWGGAVFAHPKVGRTVWTAFPESSTHFEPSTAPVMVNLLVDDLDGVLAKAAEAGVEPLAREDHGQFGRFAWLMDPAGIKLELWEPKPG